MRGIFVYPRFRTRACQEPVRTLTRNASSEARSLQVKGKAVTDTRDRDESRDRRREEALARRVGDALDELAHRDPVECPDAELIAAYYEKSLEAEERGRSESHFATCARCRKVLQVLAASADAPLDEKEVARLGKLVAAARSPLESAAPPAKPADAVRLNWRRRWLAPALGVAAVLAVWFAMRPPWRTAEQNPAVALVAQVPKSELPPSGEARAMRQSAEAAPGKNTAKDAGVRNDPAERGTESRNLVPDPQAQKNPDARGVAKQIAPASGAAEGNLRDEKKQKADSSGAPAGAFAEAIRAPAPPTGAAATSPVAAPPPPREPASRAQAKVEDAIRALADTEPPRSANQGATVTAASPQVETTTRALSGSLDESSGNDVPVNGRNYESLLALDAAGEFRVPMNAPSGKILWRAGKGGDIQRSTDAGRTWTSQASPLHEDWLAGAAVSDSICWIVGRNGAIARTTDGRHWKKIGPPPGARDSSGRLPDWSSITAVDAKSATITADERHFTTHDAGKTWTAQ